MANFLAIGAGLLAGAVILGNFAGEKAVTAEDLHSIAATEIKCIPRSLEQFESPLGCASTISFADWRKVELRRENRENSRRISGGGALFVAAKN